LDDALNLSIEKTKTITRKNHKEKKKTTEEKRGKSVSLRQEHMGNGSW
jgi:hypothetical protein